MDSVLDPSLFSIYINDLPQSIAPTHSALFADNTTIYTTGTSVEDKLNSAMSRISYWSCTKHFKNQDAYDVDSSIDTLYIYNNIEYL